MSTRVFLFILVGALVATACAQVTADPVVLTDYLGPNSTVIIDPYSQAGVYNWLIDGTNHMAQNAYWFRIGGAGVASPISSIGPVTIDQSLDMQATVLYSGATFDFEVTYALMGSDAGSGTSDLAQTVVLTNKTGSPLDLHVFEYVNMDLNGTAAGETATLNSPGVVTQTEGATQGQLTANNTPSFWEIGDASTLFNKLNASSFSNLANTASPYNGDAAFAFQWDLSMGANGSTSISQDNLVQGGVVPEPSSVMVLVGALGLLPLRRRSRR